MNATVSSAIRHGQLASHINKVLVMLAIKWYVMIYPWVFHQFSFISCSLLIGSATVPVIPHSNQHLPSVSSLHFTPALAFIHEDKAHFGLIFTTCIFPLPLCVCFLFLGTRLNKNIRAPPFTLSPRLEKQNVLADLGRLDFPHCYSFVSGASNSYLELLILENSTIHFSFTL